MLSKPESPFPQQRLRHRCRNSRCNSTLRAPVQNLHHAFCTPGCYAQFHRHRCVVCERELVRKSESQRLCGRRKCASDLRSWPFLYAFPGKPTGSVNDPLKNADKLGSKSGRRNAWRIVAGPALHPVNLLIPLDPATESRLRRVNALVSKDAAFGPSDWPLNLIGHSGCAHHSAPPAPRPELVALAVAIELEGQQP